MGALLCLGDIMFKNNHLQVSKSIILFLQVVSTSCFADEFEESSFIINIYFILSDSPIIPYTLITLNYIVLYIFTEMYYLFCVVRLYEIHSVI